MIRRVGALLAVGILGGCGGTATSTATVIPTVLYEWPEGFATHYGLVFDMPFENEPYTGGGLNEAFLIRERVTLVRADGTTAGHGVLTAIDYRPRMDTVECGGDTYVGQLAHDLAGLPVGFAGELTDGTTISLVGDREIAVYEGNAPPHCFEHHGTYTVTFGGDRAPMVKTGRYAWVNGSVDLDET